MQSGSIHQIYDFYILHIEPEHFSRDSTKIKSADQRTMLKRPRSRVCYPCEPVSITLSYSHNIHPVVNIHPWFYSEIKANNHLFWGKKMYLLMSNIIIRFYSLENSYCLSNNIFNHPFFLSILTYSILTTHQSIISKGWRQRTNKQSYV